MPMLTARQTSRPTSPRPQQTLRLRACSTYPRWWPLRKAVPSRPSLNGWRCSNRSMPERTGTDGLSCGDRRPGACTGSPCRGRRACRRARWTSCFGGRRWRRARRDESPTFTLPRSGTRYAAPFWSIRPFLYVADGNRFSGICSAVTILLLQCLRGGLSI